MSVQAFIEQLAQDGVELWLEGAKLRYRMPRGQAGPDVLERIRRRKAEVVDYLRQRAERPLPLTPGQKSLWFLQQLAPDSPAYHIAFTARILGPLDWPLLQKAFQCLLDRHAALRACFGVSEGEPWQRFRVEQALDAVLIDAAGLDEAALYRLVREHYQRPFDLNGGEGLLRLRVFGTAQGDHVLLLTVHHTVCDGWSLWLLLDEWRQAQEALGQGREPVLPPLPHGYADYLEWQRRWLDSDDAQRQWDYWRRTFASLPPPLNLPTDRPFPPKRGQRGASLALRLDAVTVAAVQALARGQGVTAYVVLLAAYAILLHRYSGQDDLCVGTPMAGRDRPETAPLVGYLVNPVPLRFRYRGEDTAEDFLAATARAVLEAMDHQDYPLALLVEKLGLSGDPSRPPLFQASFVFQQLQQSQALLDLSAPGNAAQSLNWGGLRLSSYAMPQQEGQFDLSLELMPAGDGLIGAFKYNTDVLDEASVARLAKHYRRVLELLPGWLHARLDLLPLLDADETRHIVADWNATAVDNGYATTLPVLLAACAERTPDGIALEFGQQRLSYAELARQTNRFAHYLQSRGVGPEVLVGVCLERSLEMVLALLSIVKAGGAYVPLDPDYPSDRLAFMLEDAAVGLLITSQALLENLPPYEGVALAVEDLPALLATQPDSAPAVELRLENAAYMIYTSGSTGRPKGAVNRHGAICNRLLWMQDAYRLTENDVVLQKTPFSFDVSVWEFFWPLLVGARLVVAAPGGHRDAEYLARLIQDSGVTTLHFVPSMLHAFLLEPSVEVCRGIRRIICSGEALPAELKERCYAKLPWVRLHNLYGPTEAAVDVSYWYCDPALEERSIPIGLPIANLRLYILDKTLQPVPIGVAGELHIGGVGLARGYHRRPALTAEKFIADPYGEPGGRMYKTGDLTRYRADGVIEYLGRLDHQVKLRGFRIELGEIEAVLAQCPQVSECVVVALDDPRRGKRLVAYVGGPWPEAQYKQAIAELRTQLKEQLPDYMVPSAFVPMPRLPLSPNGKIDRNALPKPDARRTGEPAAKPRTVQELRLAAIWADLLGQNDFDADTSFFEAGGHSLLAFQLMARIEQAFGQRLGIDQVFQYPSLADMARLLPENVEGAVADLLPLKAARREDPAPLSFAQERLWFLDRLGTAGGAYHLPLAYRLSGPLDETALRAALDGLVARHEALRTVFVERDGLARQTVIATRAAPFAAADGRSMSEEQRHAFLRELTTASFDLSAGPLLRVGLLREGERQWLLLLVLHHIAADGWSLGLLLDELSELYGQSVLGYAARKNSAEPHAPAQGAANPTYVSYADYCCWQRQAMAQGVFAPAEAYWLGQLRDAPQVLELPTDSPRPTVPSYGGGMARAFLDGQAFAALQALAQGESATPFMALLAAFGALLFRYSGQRDMLIATPVAGRTQAETHGLIGLFVNTLALRLDFSGDPLFTEALRRLRQTAVAAYAHQDYPFEKLVDALQPERNLARSPLCQVMFVYEERQEQGLRLAGVEAAPYNLPSVTAKFDLSLYARAQANGLELALEYASDLYRPATAQALLDCYAGLLRQLAADPSTALRDEPLPGLARVLQPAAVSRRPAAEQGYVAPRNEAERALAVIWSQVLGVERIGVHDNYFELGGDSILSIQIVAKAKQQGLKLLVQDLFLHQTLAELASAAVVAEAETPSSSRAPPAEQYGLSPAQEGMLFQSLYAPGSGVYCEQVDILLDGGPRPEWLRQAWQRTVALHDSLRSAFAWDGAARPRQRVVDDVPLPWRELDWRGRQDQEAAFAQLQAEEQRLGFALDEAPLFRFVLVRLEQEGYRLLWTYHHLLMDGWSLPLVLKQVANYYSGLAAGDAGDPPRPPLAFRDYIAWLERQDMAAAEGYWRANLRGFLSPTPLPAGHAAAEDGGYASLHLELPEQLGGRLAAVARQRRVTLNALLQAGWALLLGRCGGVADVVFGTAVSGRPAELEGIEAMVGMFINTLPVRVAISPEDSIEDWLQRIAAEQARRERYAYAAPAQIAEWSEVPAGTPLFETLLVVENYPLEAAVAADENGLRLRQLRFAERTHYPLTLVVTPGEPLRVNAMFETARLSERSVRDLLALWRHCLDELIVDADRAVGAVAWPDLAGVVLAAAPVSEPSRAKPAEAEVGYVAPRNETERRLAAIWAEVLGVDSVGVHDNYFDLGGDSILSIQIVALAKRQGLSFTLKQLFDAQSVAVLAEQAIALQTAADAGDSAGGDFPLTPILAWFFESVTVERQHFNQSVLLEVAPGMDGAALQQALDALLRHHDVLRARFDEAGDTVRAYIEVAAPMPVRGAHPTACEDIDLSHLLPGEQTAILQAHAERLQTSLNVRHGPLFSTALFRSGGDSDRLLVIVHHAAIDGVSWRILLEDLQTAYVQAVGCASRGNDAIVLPAKTAAFAAWARRLRDWAAGPQAAADAAYWRDVAASKLPALPADKTAEAVTLADTATLRLELEAPAAKGALFEWLLAALLDCVAGWSGADALLVELEGHGREELFPELDLSRSVGWFTSLYPLLLRRPQGESGALLGEVKDRLRSLPRKGLSYGVLRYLSPDVALRKALADGAAAQLRFNYLGQFAKPAASGVLRGRSHEPHGAERSPRQAFDLYFDINAWVEEGVLRLDWTYSPLRHNAETVQALAGRFMQCLRELGGAAVGQSLAEDCFMRDGACSPVSNVCNDPPPWKANATGGVDTPPGHYFPLARLSRQSLDAILARHGAVEDIYPLAPMQQGILFHALAAADSSSYFQQVHWRFSGELDVAAFRAAWQGLIQRHAPLRTAFHWQGGDGPLQVVAATVELPWREEDWSGRDPASLQQAMADCLAEDRAQGFDLEQAPLLRLRLIRLGAERYWFLWSYHHLLLDGWSLPLLLKDLFSLYGGAPTAPPPRPYRDYIAWQQAQDRQRCEDYWRAALQGFDAPIRLPIELGGERLPGAAAYGEVEATLDNAAVELLESTARQQRLTLNILLQGAWALLLQRYSGESDVLFGATVSGRPADLDGVTDMAGLFINSLPVRCRIDLQAPAVDWLRALQDAQLEREQYAYAQLADIQRWSGVKGGGALFDTLFIFENYPLESALAGGDGRLRLDGFTALERTDLPLTLLVAPGRELRLKLSYDTARFAPDALQRLLGHYLNLLRSLLANCGQRLGQLDMLDAEERQRLLALGHGPAQEVAPLGPHHWLERQARRTPERVALEWQGEAISYAQLNRRADQVAALLRRRGAGPRRLVGVCLERSPDLLAALLGVWKTGAAYLPLDPSLPRQRLAYIVEDADALLVLTESGLSSLFEGSAAPLLELDKSENTHADAVESAPQDDGQLAYVIYTSGSTGKPKGVSLSQRNLANFLQSMLVRPGLSGDDVLLAVTTVSFDIAALELYLPLLAGAKLILAGRDEAADGLRLKQLLEQRGVSVMQATPATWRLLLAAGWQGGAHFKALCGGEALAPELAEQLRRRVGALWNMYGPTETAVWSTCADLSQGGPVTLGEPIANTRLLVLDSALQPAPLGVPGALMIAGEGVAQGYHRRPALTAERFLPNIDGCGGALMYHSGDSVRWLADGCLEYLGRMDGQAKIRGYRIELGEIEAALEQHPAVSQAVVVIRALPDGDQRLAAYWLGSDADSAALREFLKALLPAYMVPSDFVFLESLPLTPSGKVDRRALPDPRRQPAAQEAPRSGLEQAVVAAWREVLQRQDIGLRDNFFDLGGHSLSLLQVWNRLQQSLDRPLQVVDLFRYPTVESLAGFLASETNAPAALAQDAKARADKQRRMMGRRGNTTRGEKTDG